MVSGGGDSMCLLRLCAEILQSGFFVVHVNHGIRAESEAEAELVRAECERLNVPMRYEKADIPALAESTKVSIETAAREYRRAVMRDLVESGEADVVLTAHHADDNAETILMHVLRGSGLKGLSGMRERDGFIVRPLIHITREQIDAFNRENKVPFATDESNYDSTYTRNFIRNEVMPLLKTRFDPTAALNRLADAAAVDEAFIRAHLDASNIKFEHGEVTIPLSAFTTEALAPRYVFEALSLLGVTDTDSRAVRRVQGLLRSGTGKRVPLGNGLTAVRDSEDITFYRAAAMSDAVQPFTGYGEYPAFGIRVLPCPLVPAAGKLRFDLNAIPAGAVLRFRRAGDRFTPYGGRAKKLKEYLIDKKIPVRTRDKLPVICYNEEVLVLCGVEISHRARLTSEARPAEIVFTGETPWINSK